MAASPYKPVSFTSESISQYKLQQLANNSQWLFENSPRMRYLANGLRRDAGLKIIAGKSGYSARNSRATAVVVHFGSFFSAGCQPVVTCVVQAGGFWLRKYITVNSLNGISAPIDHSGFIAHITSYEDRPNDHIEAHGWVHWHAIGY